MKVRMEMFQVDGSFYGSLYIEPRYVVRKDEVDQHGRPLCVVHMINGPKTMFVGGL